MTDSLKVLGQSYPNSNVLTNIYTVPLATQTTVSSIVICNQSSGPSSFRISVAPGGAADTLSQYIYYDLFLDANDTFIATIGISLATTDIIRVQSSNGNTSFSIFGVEIT